MEKIYDERAVSFIKTNNNLIPVKWMIQDKKIIFYIHNHLNILLHKRKRGGGYKVDWNPGLNLAMTAQNQTLLIQFISIFYRSFLIAKWLRFNAFPLSFWWGSPFPFLFFVFFCLWNLQATVEGLLTITGEASIDPEENEDRRWTPHIYSWPKLQRSFPITHRFWDVILELSTGSHLATS